MTDNVLAYEHNKLLETAAERDQLRDTNAELLAALERVMKVYPDMCADVGMCDPYNMSIINQARAAIEKARKEG